MTDRIISLSVGTKSDDEWTHTFHQISAIATDLDRASDFTYVSVSSSIVGDDDPIDSDGELYYDQETLTKVRRALWNVLANKTEDLPASVLDDLISGMQNEGILFRERR